MKNDTIHIAYCKRKIGGQFRYFAKAYVGDVNGTSAQAEGESIESVYNSCISQIDEFWQRETQSVPIGIKRHGKISVRAYRQWDF